MYDVLVFSGHRPDKLGGYDQMTFRKLVKLAEEVCHEYQPIWGISGMALGWDQAAAQAFCNLGIPWTAAVPFAGQESKWRKAAQTRYQELLSKTDYVEIIVPGGFTNHALLKRNKWMVDHGTRLAALWDGSEGGTNHCVQYARGRIPVVNYWSRWAGSGS